MDQQVFNLAVVHVLAMQIIGVTNRSQGLTEASDRDAGHESRGHACELAHCGAGRGARGVALQSVPPRSTGSRPGRGESVLGKWLSSPARL